MGGADCSRPVVLFGLYVAVISETYDELTTLVRSEYRRREDCIVFATRGCWPRPAVLLNPNVRAHRAVANRSTPACVDQLGVQDLLRAVPLLVTD